MAVLTPQKANEKRRDDLIMRVKICRLAVIILMIVTVATLNCLGCRLISALFADRSWIADLGY